MPATLDKPKTPKAKPAPAAPKQRGFSLFDLTSDTVQHDLLERALELAEQDGLGQEAAMEAALAAVDQLTKDKVIAYALRILQWEGEAAVLKADIARQQRRKAARETMADGLKARLVNLLPHDQVYEDTRAKVSFRNYPVLDIPNIDALPTEFVEEVPASKKVTDMVKLKVAAIQSVTEYEAQVAAHLAAGLSMDEAVKEAAPRLLKGVTVKENWKVQIK